MNATRKVLLTLAVAGYSFAGLLDFSLISLKLNSFSFFWYLPLIPLAFGICGIIGFAISRILEYENKPKEVKKK